MRSPKISYREKFAWLSLIAMAAYIPYFMISAKLPAEPLPDFRRLALFGAASVVRMIILGAGYLYLRFGSPDEARIPPDERDRAIERRSITSAYYVLMTGFILVGCFMPFSSAGWPIVNAAIFWIVVAEVIRYGAVVASYRMQAAS